MFENYSNYFNVEKVNPNSQVKEFAFTDIQKKAKGFIEFLSAFQGETFGNGLYRIHKLEDINKWEQEISQAFPEFKRRICCFAFDWLGRQFSLDSERIENGQPLIIMFEPGTGEALEIPCNFIDFHEIEIPSYHDACLASDFFKNWKSSNPEEIKHSECVGYKVPLFLGGEDVIDNLVKSDMEVYWHINSQLIQKTK
jgi:hypothetical protein